MPCIRPGRRNPAVSTNRTSRSPHLMTASTSTGALDPRRCRARTRSSSWTPTCASPTRSTTSAELAARSACRETRASIPPARETYPPVSTTVNRRPRHSTGTSIRSRVTPGSSSAIVSFPPNNRLTRVDLPTFCRPTMATVGGVAAIRSSHPGADGLQRLREHVGLGPTGGLDDEGAPCRNEGIHAGVSIVPSSRGLGRRVPPLSLPPPCSLGRRRLEEELHVGVGEDHRPDVPSLHDGSTNPQPAL